MPAHIDSRIIEELPEGPGVYLFYAENIMPLYVGKARDIRKRVLSHFAGDHALSKEKSLVRQVRWIDWITTGGEIGALLKQSALIKELQPAHNRQLRHNSELCAIALIDRGAGLITPDIVFARDLDFGRQPNLHGLFRNGKKANKVLTDLADAYGLCHSLLGLEKINQGMPCFARQIKKCHGACVGDEPLATHTMRLVEALSTLKLKTWPFAGPAWFKEGDEILVFDHWRYLGSAKTEDELWPLLDRRPPQFDRDTYRILSKVASRLKPLVAPRWESVSCLMPGLGLGTFRIR